MKAMEPQPNCLVHSVYVDLQMVDVAYTFMPVPPPVEVRLRYPFAFLHFHSVQADIQRAKAYFRSRTTNRNVFNSLSGDCMPVHYATTVRADMYIRSGDYSLEYNFSSTITTIYNTAVCLNKRFKV